MGAKAPTPAPETNGHCRPPLPPPPPPRRYGHSPSLGNTTSENVLKAEHAIAKLKVIKPGSKVWLGPKQEIEATVLEISVKDSGYVLYRTSWWSGNDRKTEWLEACELSPVPSLSKFSIGFSTQF